MATESRFAQIYRQELAKNKGIMGSLASTGGARAKEILDLRRYLLPQMGVTGAISQRIFGKPFKYGGGSGQTIRTAGPTSSITDKVVSEKLTRIDTNSKIIAKNSVVLPFMARDMNLMRMNMQKMVRLSGGTPSNRADMFFKRADERESMYESQFKKSSLVSKTDGTAVSSEKKEGGFFSGLLNFLKMPLLDMLKGIFGSIASILVKGGLAIYFFTKLGELIRNLINDKEFRKQFLNSIDTMMKNIFGEDVWKNLAIGATAVGAAFFALTNPIGILVRLTTSLVTIFGTIIKGLSGLVAFMTRHPMIFGALAVGAAAVPIINTIKETDWKNLPNFKDKDMAEFGSEVAPVLTDPRNSVMENKLLQKNIIKDIDKKMIIEQKLEEVKNKLEREKNRQALTPVDRENKKINIEKYSKQINSLENDFAENQKRLAIKNERLNTNYRRAGLNVVRLSAEDQAQNDRELARLPSRATSSPNTNTPSQINASNLQDLISSGESLGGSYDSVNLGKAGGYKGKIWEGLSDMTVEQVSAMQQSKRFNAAGKYQIIPSTLDSLIKEGVVNKTDKFDKLTQDKLFAALVARRERSAKGDTSEFLYGLSKEFASVAVPAGMRLESGKISTGVESYYDVSAGGFNKAKIRPEQILHALGKQSEIGTLIAEKKEETILDKMLAGIAGLLQVSQDTNKQIQAVAASSRGSEAPAMIESPYDREAFDSLFRFHADIHAQSL